jgi:uncharacterized protein DUF4160
MPKVATIDGIKIQFYWDEHPPSHFHAEYAEYRAQIALDDLRIMRGYIPRPQYRKVVEWAKPRRAKLLMAWMQCRSDLNPEEIA